MGFKEANLLLETTIMEVNLLKVKVVAEKLGVSQAAQTGKLCEGPHGHWPASPTAEG
jgi:hypothetical protein